MPFPEVKDGGMGDQVPFWATRSEDFGLLTLRGDGTEFLLRGC